MGMLVETNSKFRRKDRNQLVMSLVVVENPSRYTISHYSIMNDCEDDYQITLVHIVPRRIQNNKAKTLQFICLT